MSTRRGFLSCYFQSNLLLRILIGLILGAVLGVVTMSVSPEWSARLISYLQPLGDIFVRLLKMIVVPVIIFSLVVGTSSISPASLGKIGVKIIAFYLATSVLAIVIGLIVGSLFEPGLGLQLSGSDMPGKSADAPSLMKIFLDIIPTNPFSAITQGQVLPTIFFATLFGIALAFGRDSRDETAQAAANVVYTFFDGVNNIIFKIVGWVMQYAPIGVFVLIFTVFAKNGAKAFGPLLSVTFSVYAGLVLQVVFVYFLVCLLLRLSPLEFLKKVRLPMVTAFVTRSSGATIPVSMDTAEREMGVPRKISSFTIPIGATINMDGTTIYLGVCAIFIANAVGVPLDFGAKFTIVTTAVLASIGTAGVPSAGAIMLLMVLESVDLKVDTGSVVAMAYGLILGIDALLDMGRTAMNVVGDMMGTVAVAKSEGELDLSKWRK